MIFAEDKDGNVGLTQEVTEGVLRLETDEYETFFVFGTELEEEEVEFIPPPPRRPR